MSDQISVDPDRCNQAAGELETLRDVLSANVPTIINTLNMYWSSGVGHPESLAALSKAQGQAPSDATTMRTRARLAAIAAAGNNESMSSMVSIPGDVQTEDALDAKEEGQALAQAEASGNIQAIQAIEADLHDHTVSGDKAFLTAFWSNPQAASSAANLATVLNKKNGNGTTLLTSSDQQILAGFAGSLAYTTKNNLLNAAQSKQLVSEFSNTKDPWSAAMLLSSVPGSSFGTAANSTGPNLLTGTTENLLNQLQHGGYTIPFNLRSMGLGPSNSQIQAAIAKYDPLAAMMRADTQNGTAAEETMAGYNPVTGQINASQGQAWAHELMTAHTIYAPVYPGSPGSPGSISDPSYFRVLASDGPPPFASGPEWNNYTIDQNTLGQFLDASTAGPRGGGNLSQAEFSAYAAMNLIDATPAPNGDDGMKLSAPVQQALTDTAQRYMLDLADSLTNPEGSNVVNPASDMPLWHLMINGQGPNHNEDTALSHFLEQICSNKSDAATLNASAKVTFGNIYSQMQMGTLPSWFNGSTASNNMAGLLGRIDTEANNVGINLATDTDEQNEEYNKLLELGEDSAQFLPGVGDAADKAMDPLKDALGLFGIPTEFSTDNASTAQQVDSGQFADQSTQMNVWMVQGLLNNNAGDVLNNIQSYEQSHPGASHQFLQGNQIVLTNDNYSAFEDWYNNLDPKLDSKYGLSSLESRYGSYYNQQGATSSQGGSGIW